MRYLLANVSDFDPKKDAVPFDQLETQDQYMMILLNKFLGEARDCYEKYDFLDLNKKLISFISLICRHSIWMLPRILCILIARMATSVVQCKQ